MNHQPFETWLLDDKVLTLTEKRELDSHLRECTNCSALAETGFALRSARVVSPVPGFALRFQHKMAAQKLAEQRANEQKIAQQKLADQKLAEQKLAEQKLAEQKAIVEATSRANAEREAAAASAANAANAIQKAV